MWPTDKKVWKHLLQGNNILGGNQVIFPAVDFEMQYLKIGLTEIIMQRFKAIL